MQTTQMADAYEQRRGGVSSQSVPEAAAISSVAGGDCTSAGGSDTEEGRELAEIVKVFLAQERQGQNGGRVSRNIGIPLRDIQLGPHLELLTDHMDYGDLAI